MSQVGGRWLRWAGGLRQKVNMGGSRRPDVFMHTEKKYEYEYHQAVAAAAEPCQVAQETRLQRIEILKKRQ